MRKLLLAAAVATAASAVPAMAGSIAYIKDGNVRLSTDEPDFSKGCTMQGASPQSKLTIPGATQPDWGPAAVPASRPAPPVTPRVDPPPVNPPVVKPAAAAIAVTKVTLRKALRGGLAAKLTGAKPGRTTVVAKHRGKAVAKAKGTVAGDGTLAVTLKFTKAAKKSLRKLAKVKLAVSGGGASATVVLKKK